MVHRRHGWNRSGHGGDTLKKKKNSNKRRLKEGQSGIGNKSEDTRHNLEAWDITKSFQGAKRQEARWRKVEMKKSSDSGSSLFPVRTTESRTVVIHCTPQQHTH